MAAVMANIYVDGIRVGNTIPNNNSYIVNSSGLQIANDIIWTPQDNNQIFLGFSQTENASTPDNILQINSTGVLNSLYLSGESYYLYSIYATSSYSAADPLVIRYKGKIIYSTSSTDAITLAVSGKYLEDDITVTLNPPATEQNNNTLNIYTAYTASKSGTILTLT